MRSFGVGIGNRILLGKSRPNVEGRVGWRVGLASRERRNLLCSSKKKEQMVS